MRSIASAFISFQRETVYRKKKIYELNEQDLLTLANIRSEISAVNKQTYSGENNPAKRLEIREKISKNRKGKKWSDEQREARRQWYLAYIETEKGKEHYNNFLTCDRSKTPEQIQNIKDGWTEEKRKKHSETKKEFWAIEENKTRIFTDERRQILSEQGKGRVVSQETRDKISAGVTTWCEENAEKVKERNNKTNKDPEKIRKMAEKHIGMKRSEESKEKMSASAKSRIEKTGIYNKGKFQYFDPLNPDNIVICVKEEAPVGWVKGNPKARNKIVYRCPVTNKMKRVNKSENPPEGWIRITK
jgi:hypothetical protein